MTIAQSEDTCVVSGMPRAAIVKGYANKVLALDGMAAYLVNQYGNSQTERATKRISRKRTKRFQFRLRVPERPTEQRRRPCNSFQRYFGKTSSRSAILVVDDSVFARKNLIKMIELSAGKWPGKQAMA